tara:strand:- start:8711 stop:8926 length:216 start_codon:yes stop_codon:yes gene_type:complete
MAAPAGAVLFSHASCHNNALTIADMHLPAGGDGRTPEFEPGGGFTIGLFIAAIAVQDVTLAASVRIQPSPP